MSEETRRTIRLFPDWAAEWPLWGEEGNMGPGDYGLSDELTARLRRWADDFETHLDINADPPLWSGSMTWKTWIEEGRRISEVLAFEVASFADVVYDINPNEQ